MHTIMNSSQWQLVHMNNCTRVEAFMVDECNEVFSGWTAMYVKWISNTSTSGTDVIGDAAIWCI
jgi:hypothetical protein